MLTFDADTHTYRWCGKVVPSVTQILDRFTDLSMIPRDVLERKRQIGTAVHAAIELDVAGDLDESSIDESCAGYFKGWRKFRAESGFVATASEQMLYSKKYGYAGTIDLVGSLPKVEKALIDAKTTTMLYPTVGPQTAAYSELANCQKAKRFALQLTPDGTYFLEPLSDRNDWNVFAAALVLHKWRSICK